MKRSTFTCWSRNCGISRGSSTINNYISIEQFLQCALFDLALLGEELLQGFDEGVCIAQRLGDGFLLGFGGRKGYRELSLCSNRNLVARRLRHHRSALSDEVYRLKPI